MSLRTTMPAVLGVLVWALASGAEQPGAFVDVAPSRQEGASPRSTRDGVFTAAQVERGRRIFGERCAACHQPEEFATPAFMAAWSGQSAESLFDTIRSKMPTDNPGALRRQEYADLLAFLFKLNGLPAGDAELGATPAALRQVVIEAPVKSAHGGAGIR